MANLRASKAQKPRTANLHDPPNVLASPNDDGATCIRRFLAAARPMTGLDYADLDDRLKYGRALIGRLAEEIHDSRSNCQDLYECACMLYFLHNSEPIEGYSFCDGGEVATGYMLVQMHIEQRLMQASGQLENPPHKTFAEKVKAGRQRVGMQPA